MSSLWGSVLPGRRLENSFWKDKWSEDIVLCNQFPDAFRHARRGMIRYVNSGEETVGVRDLLEGTPQCEGLSINFWISYSFGNVWRAPCLTRSYGGWVKMANSQSNPSIKFLTREDVGRPLPWSILHQEFSDEYEDILRREWQQHQHFRTLRQTPYMLLLFVGWRGVSLLFWAWYVRGCALLLYLAILLCVWLLYFCASLPSG